MRLAALLGDWPCSSAIGRAWGGAELACPRGCPVARPGRLLLACGCLLPMSGRAGQAVPWRGVWSACAGEAGRGALGGAVRGAPSASPRAPRPDGWGGRQSSRHGRPVHGRRQGGAVQAPADALTAAASGRPPIGMTWHPSPVGMDDALPCLQGMRCFGWCIPCIASCIACWCVQRTSQRTSMSMHPRTHGRCARRGVWTAPRRIAGRSPLCWPMPRREAGRTAPSTTSCMVHLGCELGPAKGITSSYTPSRVCACARVSRQGGRLAQHGRGGPWQARGRIAGPVRAVPCLPALPRPLDGRLEACRLVPDCSIMRNAMPLPCSAPCTGAQRDSRYRQLARQAGFYP